MNSAAFAALAALFATAVLVMILLALIIWSQRMEQATLRGQLAAAQQQQFALRDQLRQVSQERDGLRVTSPVEWNTCLSCRSPLPVVLCPHCHAPYHQEWTSPRGVTLNCWEAVVQSGRCWNCKQDLSAFQKAAPTPVRAPVASPLAVSLALLRDSPGSPAPALAAHGPAAGLSNVPLPPFPAVLPPRRAESPPLVAQAAQPGTVSPDDDFRLVQHD